MPILLESAVDMILLGGGGGGRDFASRVKAHISLAGLFSVKVEEGVAGVVNDCGHEATEPNMCFTLCLVCVSAFPAGNQVAERQFLNSFAYVQL